MPGQCGCHCLLVGNTGSCSGTQSGGGTGLSDQLIGASCLYVGCCCGVVRRGENNCSRAIGGGRHRGGGSCRGSHHCHDLHTPGSDQRKRHGSFCRAESGTARCRFSRGSRSCILTRLLAVAPQRRFGRAGRFWFGFRRWVRPCSILVTGPVQVTSFSAAHVHSGFCLCLVQQHGVCSGIASCSRRGPGRALRRGS